MNYYHIIIVKWKFLPWTHEIQFLSWTHEIPPWGGIRPRLGTTALGRRDAQFEGHGPRRLILNVQIVLNYASTVIKKRCKNRPLSIEKLDNAVSAKRIFQVIS